MSKIVILKPTKKRVFGDKTFAGEFFDKKGNLIYDAKIHPVIISGTGAAFDTSIPNHAKFLTAIEESPQLHPFFHEGASQQFRVVDDEAEADKFLKELADERKLENYVKELSGTRLKSFGRIFGLVGSDSVIMAGLIKMASGTKGQRERLSKVINHPDKVIVELIYSALNEGDANAKTGMYKNGAGLYFYNDVPLGLGEDATVAFLKNPENASIYEALKQTYLAALKTS